METIILDSKREQYLTEVLKANGMNDLPDNVMLNKITTGSGMTSAAITSPVPYVIAVPLKRLIQNKLQWAKNNNIDMLGVYSYVECGVSKEDIINFKGNKIMVTYDSLHKVVDALKINGRIKDFKIMIDEAHHIIKSGNFRYGAINSLLDSYTEFKSFIFGTATPIEDRYQHPRLRHIQKVKVKWYDLHPVTINYCVYYTDLLKASSLAVIDHLNGKMTSNGHFFINSVNDIVSILRYVKKGGYNDPTKIRIITAGSDENEAKIIAGLGKGYKIDDINNPSNIVNFYTSTCFDGVDLSDEIGLPYIISDGSKDHSKIDIITQLPQIVGRLRNTKYSNFVNLLYSPNKYYSHTSEEEFEAYTKAKLKEAEQYVEFYKTAPNMIKEDLFKAAKENIYLQVIEDTKEVIINDTALYSEMQNYSTLNTTYYHSKKDKEAKTKLQNTTVVSNEIEYKYDVVDNIEIKGLNKTKIGKKGNFKDICIAYNEATDMEKLQIDKVYPIIKEAYAKVGFKKMKALRFEQETIKKELIVLDKFTSNMFKISNLLGYRNGQWVSSEDIKNRLQEICEELDINKVVKATDLADFYEVKQQLKWVDNVKVKGYTIIRSKFKKI